jgi:hypothetical protein
MGDTIWVDMQGRSKEELPSDNSIMLQLKDDLDGLSDKLRVPKLSEFYDYSELEAQYADLAEESDPDEPRGTWFDPAPALSAVRAIHDHLTQHPEDLALANNPRRSHWPAYLMNELMNCQNTLDLALSRGRQFRFLIVP